MNDHLWEELDCDEYFMHCLKISPILMYDDSTIGKKTREIQLLFIQQLEQGMYTKKDIVSQYSELMKFKYQKQCAIDEFKAQCKNAIDELQQEVSEMVETEIDKLIAKHIV